MKNEFITITLCNGEKQSFAVNLKKLELKDNSSIENLEPFILLQNLEKKGNQGEIVKVRGGYARNILIPRK